MNNIQFPTTFPVTCHTAFVGKDSTFVAIQGMRENGIAYITQALERGAKKIIVSHDAIITPELFELIKSHSAQLEPVEDCRKALAQLSAQAANFPAQSLKIIGITGTKGKTSTTFMTAWMLEKLGYKVALISTVHNKIDQTILPTNLTTPQPDYLQQFLKTCKEHAVDYVVMEVAAQALSLHRIEGITFDRILFTNFSQEHGEFYKTQEEYFAAKEKIFSHRKDHCITIINKDDASVAKLQNRFGDCLTISLGDKNASLYGAATQTNPTLKATVTVNGTSYTFAPQYGIGLFSLYNYLGALAVGTTLGHTAQELIPCLETFQGAPGRLQTSVMPNDARFIIDYAHNPSSFEALLSTLARETDNLIVIFGAGGERDHDKRPVMGVIAAHYAQQLFITTDNPRSEDPATITQHIVAKIAPPDCAKITIEPDRQQAIIKAYQQSKPGSIIAVLGKGADEYQLINGKKYYFSEQSIINSLR